VLSLLLSPIILLFWPSLLPAPFYEQEIKRSCMSVVLMLLVCSIKDAVIDRQHVRLYYVKVCRYCPLTILSRSHPSSLFALN
jgi:hypothetical protein